MAWYEHCYSRLLVDNHITEDDPSFMSKFDPTTYVAMVKKAGVDAAMVYACCHNGNCYYPTKVGHMHANLGGRDIYGETVGLLRREGIAPLAYYTAVFHNHSAKTHPEWRMTDLSGGQHGGRYWWSCPNNMEYRAFTREQIAEVIAYDVDGIFVDMTFWPVVCGCPSCRSRYLAEVGGEIPSVVDWHSEAWVIFQRARERWMGEFAADLTAHMKSIRPNLSVTHQFSPVLIGWHLGQSPAIAAASDYASGDFYGGREQQALGTKVLHAFSRNMPYEFMTSRCVTLYDHTSMKSEEEMLCSVAMTLANAGSYYFIDAINPDGTLVEDVYERLGSVAGRIKPFKDAVSAHRPRIEASTGLYFSMPSHVDERDSGLDLSGGVAASGNMTPSTDLPALLETLGTSVILGKEHIPYRIVTSDKVDLDGLSALIANDALFMGEGEVAKIREFVRSGGTLIATGKTSLYTLTGSSSGDFQLKDVFGVSYSGTQTGAVSYLSYFGDLDTPPSGTSPSGRQQYVQSSKLAPLVKATTAHVLAGVSLPYFDPSDPERYASIHSNPPGQCTDYAGLTVNRFGRGKCVYLYSSLPGARESARSGADFAHAQQHFGGLLFRQSADPGMIVRTNAPGCVEIATLRSTVQDAFLVCLVNYQKELPNIPVKDISLSLRLPVGRTLTKCVRVSNGSEVQCEERNDELTLNLPRLETMEIFELHVKPL